ncbi:MAG TPA: DUF6636 domain-containing protein [Gaiellaceae bacterium]
MARRALVVALVVVAVGVTAAPAGAVAHWKAFRTPSKNIGCLYVPAFDHVKAFLRCDILSGLEPRPTASCELDWVGLMLHRIGKARPACAGDTVYKQHSHILKYGHRWSLPGVACLSKRTGLRCRNTRGHGFVLAREHWSRF